MTDHAPGNQATEQPLDQERVVRQGPESVAPTPERWAEHPDDPTLAELDGQDPVGPGGS